MLLELDLFLSELYLNCFLFSTTQYESLFVVKVIKCESVADSTSSMLLEVLLEYIFYGILLL